jgi:hypothetical protein
MSDIIITPASGKIDFYQDLGASSLAKIELTAANDLALSTTSGNLIIGDASRDVYIGNGINDVDIIFEQNGEIRPLPSKTLNIGTSGSFTQILASKVNINQNSFTSIPLDVYSSTSGATILNVAGTKGTLFSVTDNLSGSLMSVNNDAGLPVFEVFSDDRVVAGRFGQNDFIMTSGGNVGIGVGSPTSKLQVSGLVTANSGNFTQSLQVNGTGVWHSGNFDSSNIVRTIGTQTISGVKTFADGLKVVGNGINTPIELGSSADAVVLFGKTSNGLGINSVSTSYNDGGTNYIDTRELLIGKGANSPGYDEQLLFAGNSGIGVVHYFDNGGGVSASRLIFDVTPATTLASANTTLRTTTADGNNIVLNLPNTSGTLALLTNINTSQITGVLSVSKGGTNTSTYSNGQLLIGSGISLVANTLTTVSGIGIINGSGSITIGVTGIPSSSITNFNSGVSGLLPNIANSGNNRILTSDGSNIGINANSNLYLSGNNKNVLNLISITGVNNRPTLTIGGIGLSNLSGTPSASFLTNGRLIIARSDQTFVDIDAQYDTFSIDGSLNVDPNIAGTINCMFVNAGPSIGGSLSTDTLYINQSVTNVAAGLGSIYFLDSSTNTSFLLDAENGLTLYGYGSSTLLCTDRNNDRIGIGTAIPSSELQVSGLITANSGNFTNSLQLNGSGVGLYDTSVFNLGTISGTNAINCGQDRQIQTLTLNGVATTFTTGTGWPSSNSVSRETTLNIFSSGNTSVTWTIVNDWYRQPDSPLPSGRHIVLLRGIGSGIVEGHYIGSKSN